MLEEISLHLVVLIIRKPIYIAGIQMEIFLAYFWRITQFA